MNLSNGQQIKLRMIGSDKVQDAIVHGDSPESQYIEITGKTPFRISINNSDLQSIYNIII